MLTTPRLPPSLLVVFSPMKFEEIQLAINPPSSSPGADIYIKYIPKLQNPVLKIIFLPGEHFIVLIIFTACPTDARSCCLEKMVFCSFSLGRLDFFPFDKLKYHSARQYPSVFPLHRGGDFPSAALCFWSKYCLSCVYSLGQKTTPAVICFQLSRMHGIGQKWKTCVFLVFVSPDPFSHCIDSSKPCPGAADGVPLLPDEAKLYWKHQNVPPRLPGDVQHLTGCILVLLSFISGTVNDWWERNRNLIGF